MFRGGYAYTFYMYPNLTYYYNPYGLNNSFTKYISANYISYNYDMVFVGQKSSSVYQYCVNGVGSSGGYEIELLGDSGAIVYHSKHVVEYGDDHVSYYMYYYAGK